MIEHDTIAAISTPAGTGAIAVVRISGSKTYKILEQIFSTSSKELKNSTLRSTGSHKAIHGYILSSDHKEIIDEVVCVLYREPKTYTGEDLVEINCHGNPLIANQILSALIDKGARLALPGEFTQRAFLTGKLDLTQAESVLDLIQAKTGRQSRLALSALSGHLGKRILEVRSDLMNSLSKLVAGIDFPEEVGEMPKDDLKEIVQKSLNTLEELLKTARSGKFLREGLKLSIVGRPNAGKSSLLNQLLKFDRAIVSDTPGTTRDSIEETLDIKGIPITLIDTAGVRLTEDSIEKAGIDRTTRAISASDLVLFVIDTTLGWKEPEEKISELVDNVPSLIVFNKIDHEDSHEITNDNSLNTIASVKISALEGTGIEALNSKIERWAVKDNAPEEAGGSLNQRQAELLALAVKTLRNLLDSIDAMMLEDALATDLKSAIHNLSEAAGDEVTEEVITEVFSRFCIGK